MTHLLDEIPYITGYTEKFQSPQLSDFFDLDIGTEWGRLFMLCRDSNGLHMEAMFTLGTLAFADNANMSLLRSLAAICILKDAKHLELPSHTRYYGFRVDEKPTQESLQASMDGYPEILKDGESLRRPYNSPPDSETLSREECHTLAKKLLRQWPCRRPLDIKITATHIDVNKAIDMVRAEWLRLFKNFEFAQSLLEIRGFLTNIKEYPIRWPRIYLRHVSYGIPLQPEMWRFPQYLTFLQGMAPHYLHWNLLHGISQ